MSNPHQKGQHIGKKLYPEYRKKKYIHGNRHDPWTPNDDWFPWRPEGGGGKTMFKIISVTTAGTDSPYNGLKVAQADVEVSPCNKSGLIGETIEVVDWSECLFDEDDNELVDRVGWAFKGIAKSKKQGAGEDDLTPCHWVADNICCPPPTE